MIYYLSLVLILSGMLLIIYSLISSKKPPLAPLDHNASDPNRIAFPNRIVHSDLQERPVHEDHPAPSIHDGLAREPYHAESPGVQYQNENPQPAREVEEIKGDSPAPRSIIADTPQVNQEQGTEATLYEDASSVIDYDTHENSIDPTFAEYKKIRRIGRGFIEIARQGINFHAEKKFYRFDFHRIREIKVGAAYLAVFLKGSDATRIFLFDKEVELKADIIAGYQDYKRRTV